MPSDTNENEETAETQRVSVRLPIQLVDRANLVSDVNNEARTQLIERAIQGALAFEGKESYQEYLKAAYKRGEISEEAYLEAVETDGLPIGDENE